MIWWCICYFLAKFPLVQKPGNSLKHTTYSTAQTFSMLQLIQMNTPGLQGSGALPSHLDWMLDAAKIKTASPFIHPSPLASHFLLSIFWIQGDRNICFLHGTFIYAIDLTIILITDIFLPLTCTLVKTKSFATRICNSEAPDPLLHMFPRRPLSKMPKSTLKFLLCTLVSEQNMIVDLPLQLVTTQGVYSCITLEKSI